MEVIKIGHEGEAAEEAEAKGGRGAVIDEAEGN
jgi:hypothetical protein